MRWRCLTVSTNQRSPRVSRFWISFCVLVWLSPANRESIVSVKSMISTRNCLILHNLDLFFTIILIVMIVIMIITVCSRSSYVIVIILTIIVQASVGFHLLLLKVYKTQCEVERPIEDEIIKQKAIKKYTHMLFIINSLSISRVGKYPDVKNG